VSLAAEPCGRDGWKNAAGKPCTALARLALPRVAAGLGIVLPPKPG